MTDFIGYRLRCPVCSTELFVEIPVGVHPVAHETDFRPVFRGPDPIGGRIHACPACRYAGYRDGFEHDALEDDEEELLRTEHPPVRPLELPGDEDLDDLRRWIRSGQLERDTGVGPGEPSAAERYLLAARCREFLGDEDHVAIADLYVCGAWSARSAGAWELERRLLAEASIQFGRALDGGTVPESDRTAITYVAAEVARRAGEFGRAVDLFGQIEPAGDPDDPDARRLDRLARRQESLAVMQSAVNARMPDEEEEEPER
jgi:uncharacterized protein (DUF2225 family)